MTFGHQLRALFYKDYVIRKIRRHYLASFIELLLPLLLILLILYLRSKSGDQASTDPASFRHGPNSYAPLGPYDLNDMYFYRFHVEPKNEDQIYRLLRNENSRIIYAPYSPYTESMMKAFYRPNATRVIQPYNTTDDLSLYLSSTDDVVDLAVLFDDSQEAGHMGYTIRFNNTRYHLYTRKKFPDQAEGKPRSSSFTFEERHMLWPSLYALFEQHVSYHNLSADSTLTRPQLRPFPTGEYMMDATFTSVAQFIPTLLSIGCLFFVVFFCKQIIEDKQSRIRELLRMMGLSDYVYWSNLILVGGVTMGIITTTATICFCFNFGEAPVLTNSSGSVIFVVLTCFGISAIMQNLLITVIINSPSLGSIVSLLTWFITMLVASTWLDPQGKNRYMTLSVDTKLWTSLMPCSALYWCFKIITFWEQSGTGVHWHNIAQIARAGDNISLLPIIGMMVFSWFFYGILIVYLDAVIPWQYGMPKHPLFFLKKSYWFTSEGKDLANGSTKHLLGSDRTEAIEMFERPPPNSGDPVVVLRNIMQQFGQKRAVDDLSLDLYRDQITVILGHNGAGKTTTMNILTGLFPPTSGEMYINGYSVRENTKRARQGVGLCPQHNVLFNELTVDEHLWFFAKIKGAPDAQIDAEIVQLLEKFQLSAKRYELAEGLSGGMKRKLCMANAMVGGSNILILDEPTAGMDPQARRGVWSILQEVRRSRTVLLTTHYMEEADVLGDRIAFLTAGRLKCAGSPMFLKKKFETGYNMRCAKVSAKTDVEQVYSIVEHYLGKSQVHMAANLGLEFCINLGFPTTQALVPLFRHLEDQKVRLGIASLGVSVTTMEDVFLKVGELDELDSGTPEKIPSNKNSGTSLEISEKFPRFTRVYGSELFMNQFRALFMKRINSIKRQWYMPIFLILLPVLLAIMFCYFEQKTLTAELDEDTLSYSFSHLYPKHDAVGFLQSGKLPGNLASSMDQVMSKDNVAVNEVSRNGNITEYLLSKAAEHSTSYKDKWVMGATHNDSANVNEIWFNGEAFHFAAAALVNWQKAVLQHLTNSSTSKVEIKNQPLGKASEDGNVFLLVFVRFASLFPISLAASFLTCSLVFFPVQERVSKAQLVQMMSGVHRIIFFGASFLFDLLLILISSVFMVLVFVTYDPAESFTTFSDTWIASWTILFIYGFTMIPIAYIASYFFKSPSTGFTALLCFSSVTGCVLVLIMSIVDLLSILPGNPLNLDLVSISKALHILNYVPPFSVVWGFTNIHLNGVSKMFCDSLPNQTKTKLCFAFPDLLKTCCNSCGGSSDIFDLESGFCFKHESPFRMDIRDGAGYQMLAMFITGVIAFALLILIETNSQKLIFIWEFLRVQKIRNALCSVFTYKKRGGVPNLSSVATEEDEDVHKEKRAVDQAVTQGQSGNYALVAHQLSKYYGGFKAVDDISFRVHDKECFGLLGVNGAGKTTTFGMLTGDHLMSAGNAYIKNSNLRTSVRKFQGFIGYCPQFDALIDTMTGREMLELFCALRGVPHNQTKEMVNFMVSMADLEEHASKPTGTYSGGNKRKLSIAIAMIGNPHVMFLDEPTAGVDPAARRKIWATLMQAQKETGSAIILTSHSMEECEALCNRLCIMVNGSFRCLGSSQHLKSKFGQGFTVLIKLKAAADEKIVTPKVCAMMDQLFPGENKLKDNHQCLLHFHITDTSLRWSTLFERIEELKKTFDFEDVVVSDTTLEQIFLAFAKTQRGALDDDSSSDKAKTKVL